MRYLLLALLLSSCVRISIHIRVPVTSKDDCDTVNASVEPDVTGDDGMMTDCGD